MIKTFKQYNEGIEYRGYMMNSYGHACWLEVYNFLLEEGYDDGEANCILQSKHMRWANDFTAKTDLEGFLTYYNKYKKSIDDMLDSEYSRRN